MTEKKPFDFKKWGSLLILSLALAIIVIDGTVLNVSISNLIKDLNSDLKSIQWAITLYSLITASLTITGGRLGDLFGRKKMFIGGAALFAVGSLITSFAQNMGMLIFGWSVVEGIGAALMLPATASLITTNFFGKERSIAFGVWGGVAGASAAFGPLLGGYLTTNFSWRWAFLINVFIVLILIIGSVIIKDEGKREKQDLDFVGVILSTLGLGSVVYGIIESSTYGWIKASKDYLFVDNNTYNLGGLSISLYTIAIGFLILVGFVLWENYLESKNRIPLVSMSLFFNKQFTVGIAITTVLALGQTGLVFAIPVFFQSVRGKSAFDTGLALLPLSLSLLFTAPLSGFLATKIKSKYIILTGLIVGILGAIVLYFSLSVDADTSSLALGQILYGVGMGMIMAQVSNITLSSVDISKIGQASGINSMIRQVGASLGSAIIGAAFLSTLSSNLTTGINDSKNFPQPLKSSLTTIVDKDTSAFQFGGDKFFDSFGPKFAPEIKDLSHKAIVEGSKNGMIYVAVFLTGSIFVAAILPKNAGSHKSKKKEKEEAVMISAE